MNPLASAAAMVVVYPFGRSMMSVGLMSAPALGMPVEGERIVSMALPVERAEPIDARETLSPISVECWPLMTVERWTPPVTDAVALIGRGPVEGCETGAPCWIRLIPLLLVNLTSPWPDRGRPEVSPAGRP